MTGHAFHIKHQFATDFLEAMGIDHSRVKSVKIEMGVDIVTTVEVEYLMEVENLEDINNLTKKYILYVSEIVE